jgi:2-keto-3-deoxy-galactonokinase
MSITIVDRGRTLRDRLRERLERAADLRCTEHDESVIAVTIHGRENGWFDATYVTCCEILERQAAAVVKERL